MFKELLNTAYVVYKAGSQPVSQTCEEISHEKALFLNKEHFFNPKPDIIRTEIQNLINIRHVSNKNLKKDWGLRKLNILQFYSALTDQHELNISKPSFLEKNCAELIEKIEKKSDSVKRPLNVIEQLESALEIANQNLSVAVLNLAIASRIMARNYDTRIFDLKVTPTRMRHWKTCVAGFDHNEELNDPPGDTYHFWFAILAGISSQENRNPKDLYENLTAKICDLIYLNTENLTKIIQKGIFHIDRKTHPTIDRLGYKIGESLVNC